MRGVIRDQDLTDFALNELDLRDRTYVESMLAVSTECRNDVYKMLELSKMLEDGFAEQDEKFGELTLSEGQRELLLRGPRRPVVRPIALRLAAVLVVSAVAAFGLSAWVKSETKGQAFSSQFAALGSAVGGAVENLNDVDWQETLRQISDEPNPENWLTGPAAAVVPPVQGMPWEFASEQSSGSEAIDTGEVVEM